MGCMDVTGVLFTHTIDGSVYMGGEPLSSGLHDERCSSPIVRLPMPRCYMGDGVLVIAGVYSIQIQICNG